MSVALLLAASPATSLGATFAVPRAIVVGRDLGVPYLSLSGVPVDPRHGEVVVSDAGRHEIATFDSTGNLLGWYVHQVPDGKGGFIDGTPAWLAVDGAGHTLVSDMMVPWVDVLDFRGRSVARLELPSESGSFGQGAGAIAVASDGSIFVASRGDSGRVHRFGPDYRHLGAWGVAGADSGQLSGITGLAVSSDGRVVVTCALTRLGVQVFDVNGVFRHGFGFHDMGAGNFSLPSAVGLTADGRTWVADEIRQVVQVFDRTGAYVGMFGGMGTAPGEFRFPRALATDGRDMLVVGERVGNRFQVWRTR